MSARSSALGRFGQAASLLCSSRWSGLSPLCAVAQHAAHEDGDVIAAAPQEAGGVVRPLAHAADDDPGRGLVELPVALAQGAKGDVRDTLDGVGCELCRLAHVEQSRAGRPGGIEVADAREGDESRAEVLSDAAGEVHRVLRRAEGRGVRELQGGEVRRSAAEAQGRRDGINPGLDAVPADGLCAEETAVLAEEELQRHLLRARVVVDVGEGMEQDAGIVLAVVKAFARELALVLARGGGGQGADLEDARVGDAVIRGP